MKLTSFKKSQTVVLSKECTVGLTMLDCAKYQTKVRLTNSIHRLTPTFRRQNAAKYGLLPTSVKQPMSNQNQKCEKLNTKSTCQKSNIVVPIK